MASRTTKQPPCQTSSHDKPEGRNNERDHPNCNAHVVIVDNLIQREIAPEPILEGLHADTQHNHVSKDPKNPPDKKNSRAG